VAAPSPASKGWSLRGDAICAPSRGLALPLDAQPSAAAAVAAPPLQPCAGTLQSTASQGRRRCQRESNEPVVRSRDRPPTRRRQLCADKIRHVGALVGSVIGVHAPHIDDLTLMRSVSLEKVEQAPASRGSRRSRGRSSVGRWGRCVSVTGTHSVHARTCTPLHHSAPRNARIVSARAQ